MAGTSSFEAWIRREVKRLSGCRTVSIRRLAALAQGDRPRLVEPLLLYAVCSHKVGQLMPLVWRQSVKDSYRYVLPMLEGIDLERAALSENIPTQLPRMYGKFLTSYRSYRLLPDVERRAKDRRRDKVLTMQAQLGVSTLSIARALDINCGNLNVWLKHGDPNKITPQNAARVVRYLRGLLQAAP